MCVRERGACGVMIIIIGNGNHDLSPDPGE